MVGNTSTFACINPANNRGTSWAQGAPQSDGGLIRSNIEILPINRVCFENNPKSIAVGCIYLISQNYELGFTKKEIAEQCHTSEVTVSNTYGQMVKFKKFLIPKN